MERLAQTEFALLKGRWESVLERLEVALVKAGRPRSKVELVAVSKFHPAPALLALASLGQVSFGENYVQEALAKKESLSFYPEASEIRWHMIGHVQRKKANLVTGAFSLIHTLDSKELAFALEKSCATKDLTQSLLIEVNVGGEKQKSGIAESSLHELCDFVVASCPHLVLKGLMCIPPVYDAGASARPYFAKLRQIRDALQSYSGLSLPHLSMGMSGDFEWAVLEGATFIRVGTDIFGPRPQKNS